MSQEVTVHEFGGLFAKKEKYVSIEDYNALHAEYLKTQRQFDEAHAGRCGELSAKESAQESLKMMQKVRMELEAKNAELKAQVAELKRDDARNTLQEINEVLERASKRQKTTEGQ